MITGHPIFVHYDWQPVGKVSDTTVSCCAICLKDQLITCILVRRGHLTSLLLSLYPAKETWIIHLKSWGCGLSPSQVFFKNSLLSSFNKLLFPRLTWQCSQLSGWMSLRHPWQVFYITNPTLNETNSSYSRHPKSQRHSVSLSKLTHSRYNKLPYFLSGFLARAMSNIAIRKLQFSFLLFQETGFFIPNSFEGHRNFN